VSEAFRPSPAAAENMTAQTRTFRVDRDDVRRIDEWIETVGRHWGESQRTVFGARLCVAELAANVVEHGVAKPGRDHIIVTLTQCDDGIGIEFLDCRAQFDPTGTATAERPGSLDAAAIRGRGLMLLRAYAKDFAYRNDGAYNRVTLTIKSR
jgi:anti-sigma regulatory factor (Ser/Thr protein kinase)